MSKRNGFGVTSMLTSSVLGAFGLAALTGTLLVTGCRQKQADGSSSSSSSGADESAKMPGITATEIKIGQTMPYSGPASAFGTIGRGDLAYFKMINENGGIHGRKINLISLDDGYSPPKTVEQTRKLVEGEGVAFMFGSIGTAPNTAVQPYLNDKQVPQLFVVSGAHKFADPAHHHWTIGWQPSFRVEAKIYARYLLEEKPTAKVCVLFQNDDLGKDYLAGLREGLGDQYDNMVIKSASYEVTDPTVDSQIVMFQGAGCDTLITAAIPRFAAQAIRKVFDIGWRPLHILSNIAVSLSAALKPAGLDKSIGIITGNFLKDPNDPEMASDPGMMEYFSFMKKYLPELDPKDTNTVFAYGMSMTLVKVLMQCGDDLSRENIMRQATNLTKFVVPVMVSGTELSTSPTNYRAFSQLRLARFNGTNFVPFGDVLSAD